MSCYLSPTRFWPLLCRPFSKTIYTSLGTIHATAARECLRTEITRCTHASLRATTRVNMPAAHRDPSVPSSVGLVYLADGIHTPSADSFRAGPAADVSVTVLPCICMYIFTDTCVCILTYISIYIYISHRHIYIYI